MSAYQALYRKWRPMTFDDVIGQGHISATLKSSVNSGRIAHAYLFCGTRGTGKTSTAKIFSRAVNCEHPVDGEPCNECPTCRGILNGSILDVYEMDAASNRGVDSIRGIRDEVVYAASGCKYKVYIVDEVHMLTEDAFNALLKTLEEPPPHVIFILATTEIHKIPQTVLSRCQRFDFRRIGIDEIAGRITQITETEGIDITPDAAELIAELGDGSMRDAISILDRCAAFGNEQLTTDIVSEIIGMVPSKYLFEIAGAISEDDSKSALIRSGEVLKSGAEVLNFLENLTDHFRNLLICKSASSPGELLEKTASATEKYVNQAEKFSVSRILFSIKELSAYLSQAKWMSNPKIAVEMAMVKLCNPSYSTDTDALLARIEKLERLVANLSYGGAAAPPQSTDGTNKNPPPWDISPDSDAEAYTPAASEDKPRSGSPHEGDTWEFWAEALSEVKKESHKLFAFLYVATATLNGNVVEIEVGSELTYNKIATPAGIDYLSKLFSRVSGSNLGVKVFIKGERPAEENDQSPSIKDLAAKKDILGDKMDIV